MGWEYAYLKRELRLPPDPLRDAFETWCTDSWDEITRTEWSVRFGERLRLDRWVHSCRVRSSLTLRARLFSLAAAAGHDGPLLPLSSGDWNRLILDRTKIAVVGYDGGEPGSDPGCERVLKVYLGLDPARGGWDDDVFAAVAPSFPGLQPPPGAPGIMLSAVLTPGRDPSPRLYVFYDADDLEVPAVRAWLGERLPVARLDGYRRVALALKADRADTAYFRINTPDTPRRLQAEAVAADVPPLAARMKRATYCGLPAAELAAEQPSELSVYVRIT